MASSRDYEYLKTAWKGWYEASGRPIKNDYERFVELSNMGSRDDGKLLFSWLFQTIFFSASEMVISNNCVFTTFCWFDRMCWH